MTREILEQKTFPLITLHSNLNLLNRVISSNIEKLKQLDTWSENCGAELKET